jgi:hypothetical protein
MLIKHNYVAIKEYETIMSLPTAGRFMIASSPKNQLYTDEN